MNNVKLMKKVIELDTQTLHSREQSLRVMVQISFIRKAYGVKNNETNEKVLDYERERILTDQEIEKDFNDYIGFWKWAKTNSTDKAIEYENKINYIIDAVRFFDEKLANSFTESFQNILKVA